MRDCPAIPISIPRLERGAFSKKYKRLVPARDVERGRNFPATFVIMNIKVSFAPRVRPPAASQHARRLPDGTP